MGPHFEGLEAVSRDRGSTVHVRFAPGFAGEHQRERRFADQ
jgi:hypothetical protein